MFILFLCFCLRQIAKLETQKKQNSNKLNRLKAETRKFESQVDVLHRSASKHAEAHSQNTHGGASRTTFILDHDTKAKSFLYISYLRVNEWKFAEKTDNCTTYTFLHETVHLELVYEESCGKWSSTDGH